MTNMISLNVQVQLTDLRDLVQLLKDLDQLQVSTVVSRAVRVGEYSVGIDVPLTRYAEGRHLIDDVLQITDKFGTK